MANINKIRISGSTYNIEDSSATKTVKLTQAQYNQLSPKDPNTFYIITDAEYFDPSGYVTSAQTESAITAAVSGKQDTLISGTNIKTINNESILGSGNITIQGGGGGIDSGTVQTMIDESISGKTDTSTFTAHTGDSTIHVTSSEKSTWNAKSDFSGSYNDLTNKPSIPSKTSDLTNDSDFATSGYVDSVVSGKANSSDVYTKSQTSGATEIATALSGKQDTLSAGTNITIVDNVISAEGGMTEDDELLLSTALTDLNDRKIDASEVKTNYQRKGDYATKSYVTTALEPYETKLDEINTEEVTAYALNDLNERFGGLKIVKITESEYAALTAKDENTLYIVVADQS